MRSKLLQFDTSELIIGNNNIMEAAEWSQDIAFNESYIIVGEEFIANKIHATYDLTVIGDLRAKQLDVSGDLFVRGNIYVDGTLTCKGEIICSGEILAESIVSDSYCMTHSLRAENVSITNGVHAQLTAEAEEFKVEEGFVFAGEGVISEGEIKAKAVIAGDYCDVCNDEEVFTLELNDAISSDYNENKAEIEYIEIARNDIEKHIQLFNEVLQSNITEWSLLEEEEFVAKLKYISNNTLDLHAISKIVDRIIDISYEDAIDELGDYLYVFWADQIFPKELKEYETLEPVFSTMLKKATKKIDSLNYKSNGLNDFCNALYTLREYGDVLDIYNDECADRIFSSIGIRYTTVLHAWRDING